MGNNSNGHCPRCKIGWIMPPDKFFEQGCLNCGWYDYLAGHDHDKNYYANYTLLLQAIFDGVPKGSKRCGRRNKKKRLQGITYESPPKKEVIYI